MSDELPALERVIDLPSMVAYAGATWDWHRMHYDRDWIDKAGLPGPVVDGQMLGALMAEQLLDHFGSGAFITRLSIRYRSLMLAGDAVRIEAKVSDGGDGLMHALQTLTVGGRIVAEGEATVRL